MVGGVGVDVQAPAHRLDVEVAVDVGEEGTSEDAPVAQVVLNESLNRRRNQPLRGGVPKREQVVECAQGRQTQDPTVGAETFRSATRLPVGRRYTGQSRLDGAHTDRKPQPLLRQLL